MKKKAIEADPPATEPVRAISHDEISRLAYFYWEARGHSGGNPDQDWFRAEQHLLELAQNR